MELLDNLHLLKVPIPDNPLGFLNAYLVRGDNECLLVDTGWNVPHALDSLEEQLRKIGVGFGDITQIVVTHIHPDHFGLVGKLKRLSPATVAMHQVEKDILDSRYMFTDGLIREMGQWLRLNGVPDEDVPDLQTASLSARGYVSYAVPDVGLQGGEKYHVGDFELEVIWTPGHSSGHVCLYDPKKKLLFSGDHILPTITPNISLHVQSMANPLADYIKSLQAIRELDVEMVLPAHEHVFYDVRRRIEEILQHHAEREEAILSVMGQEPRTAFEIAPGIPWNTLGVAWKDLPALTQRIAVTEVLAHLEHMRTEGRVETIRRGNVILYRVA